MKIVCIINKLRPWHNNPLGYNKLDGLTLMKTYTIIPTQVAGSPPSTYYIKNDRGEHVWYSTEFFRTLEDHRVKVLNEIGI